MNRFIHTVASRDQHSLYTEPKTSPYWRNLDNKDPWSMLIRYRSDAKVSDRYLISVDQRVLAIWELVSLGASEFVKVTTCDGNFYKMIPFPFPWMQVPYKTSIYSTFHTWYFALLCNGNIINFIALMWLISQYSWRCLVTLVRVK